MSEQNKALVRRFYQAFDKGDLHNGDQFLASTFVAYVPGAPGPLDRNGFIPFAQMFRAAFPDARHVFDDVIAEGEKVVTVGTFQGTHKGELQGIPPTGKQIKIAIMHVDRVVGGKIVEHRGVTNMMELMQQLGAIPAPAQTGR